MLTTVALVRVVITVTHTITRPAVLDTLFTIFAAKRLWKTHTHTHTYMYTLPGITQYG